MAAKGSAEWKGDVALSNILAQAGHTAESVHTDATVTLRVPEAYSPLGTGKHLGHRVVRNIAARIGRTPAQVLLRWCLQHGVPIIPKSTHRERIAENAQVFDFTLAEADMAALNGLDRTKGSDRALERTWWR